MYITTYRTVYLSLFFPLRFNLIQWIALYMELFFLSGQGIYTSRSKHLRKGCAIDFFLEFLKFYFYNYLKNKRQKLKPILRQVFSLKQLANHLPSVELFLFQH